MGLSTFWARDLRDGTPVDTLVLVPPSAEMFKLRSRRSVVVEFKGFPLVDRGDVGLAGADGGRVGGADAAGDELGR